MLGIYNYTVILTYIGTLFGFSGITFAVNGNVRGSLLFLMAAGVCDMFDGKIARTRQRTFEEKRFGIQIDSLCDLISFGVLPAAIGFSLTGFKPICIVVYTLYILAAVIRLAYYNVTEEIRQDNETGEREYYEGLPVTNITIIVPLLYLIAAVVKDGVISDKAFAITYVVILFIVGCAFVTGFKVKKHPFKREIKG